MSYTIREHNIKPHADIEVDILAKKDGQMTFTLRINGGNIVDYNLVEYVDTKKKYVGLNKITPVVTKKSTLSSSDGKGSGGNPVRSDNV